MKSRKKVVQALAGSLVCLITWIAAPAVAQATITISDPQVTEGDGPTTMTFVVARSPGSLGPSVQVGFQTADGTAQAPGDYTAAQGVVRFDGGDLLGQPQFQTITIAITGDTIFEGNDRAQGETFTVTLSGSQEIVKPTGTGTILDNDPPFTPPSGRSAGTDRISQQLISRTPNGGLPNAAVFEPVISGDARIARYVAYSSAATNIAGATDGGHRNIFLVKRGGSAGKFGTPWKYGSTKLASPGRGGSANGDSYGPALGGWTKGDTAKKPKCLGFVSQASNLVAGDANNHADAFTRKLPSGKPKRVKSPAAVSEVAVSGDCRVVAVVAGGSLYVKRSGKKLRKLVSGGVSSPNLTFTGFQVSYSRNGKVLVRRAAGGGVKSLASGANSSADSDKPSGKVSRISYERGGATYIKGVGAGEKRMEAGSTLPVTSGGGSQAAFAAGPFAYLYAVSNSFGKVSPQGFCPDQSFIDGLDLSARGNYIVLSCTGGAAYLSFLGGK